MLVSSFVVIFVMCCRLKPRNGNVIDGKEISLLKGVLVLCAMPTKKCRSAERLSIPFFFFFFEYIYSFILNRFLPVCCPLCMVVFIENTTQLLKETK